MKNRKFNGNPTPDRLPSHLQLGDYCDFVVYAPPVEGGHVNQLTEGRVVKVHFDKRKVTYDLEFTVSIDQSTRMRNMTRIHNVDSAFVSLRDMRPKDDEPIEKSAPSFDVWYTMDQPPVQAKDADVSKDVLIDLDGRRIEFRVGCFNWVTKEWELYDEAAETLIELEHLRWQALPLAI